MNGYCPNISIDTILINTDNSRTNEPSKFFLGLPQRLDLASLNKNVTLQNGSIYYTWKNITMRQHSKRNKFELSDGSYSVLYIQYYIK